MNILLVEDEPSIREMMVIALERAGYRATTAATAEEAERKVAAEKPDLILLDWMLPAMSGIELARRLRRDGGSDVPIIMLTARGEESDRIRGLAAGANDYVTKPFSPRLLMARMEALLKRDKEEPALCVGDLRLDAACHRVTAGGRNVDLSPTEYRLLLFFMQLPERVHSREQLVTAVWGDAAGIDERTVDVHIRRLRKALTATGHDRYVQTVRGSGYRLSCAD